MQFEQEMALQIANQASLEPDEKIISIKFDGYSEKNSSEACFGCMEYYIDAHITSSTGRSWEDTAEYEYDNGQWNWIFHVLDITECDISPYKTTDKDLCYNNTDPKTWTVTLDDINVSYDIEFN